MKLRLSTTLIAAFFMIALVSACNNEGADQAKEGDAAAAAAEGEQAPDIQAVAWDALEDLIPKTAAGLPRTNAAEDKSSLGNVGFSHALGIYEKDGKRVEVQILDAGSKSIILSTMAPWLKHKVSEEDMTGFERTITYAGYPAFEKLNKGLNESQISVVMKDRFIVMVVGTNVALEELKKVMDGLDLKKLEGM